MEKKIITQVGEIVDVAERDVDHVYVATKHHGLQVFTKLGNITHDVSLYTKHVSWGYIIDHNSSKPNLTWHLCL